MEKQVYITEKERGKCKKVASMFAELRHEWFNTTLYLMVKGTLLMKQGYDAVFKSLPKEKQTELIGKKGDFAKAADISLKNQNTEK